MKRYYKKIITSSSVELVIKTKALKELGFIYTITEMTNSMIFDDKEIQEIYWEILFRVWDEDEE